MISSGGSSEPTEPPAYEPVAVQYLSISLMYVAKFYCEYRKQGSVSHENSDINRVKHTVIYCGFDFNHVITF